MSAILITSSNKVFMSLLRPPSCRKGLMLPNTVHLFSFYLWALFCVHPSVIVGKADTFEGDNGNDEVVEEELSLIAAFLFLFLRHFLLLEDLEELDFKE